MTVHPRHLLNFMFFSLIVHFVARASMYQGMGLAGSGAPSGAAASSGGLRAQAILQSAPGPQARTMAESMSTPSFVP